MPGVVFFVAALATAPAPGIAAGDVEWRCSVEGRTWQLQPVPLQQQQQQKNPPPLVVNVNASAKQHEIEGFGGCFNEKGWDALSALEDGAKSRVLQNLFGDQGLRWGLNRMPVGSSDFADSYYSLDDTAGDLAMSNLSLARDEQKLLPFIKAAMQINPKLKLWGSPWSGPTWLKDSNLYYCGSLSTDPKKRAAYALYLAKAAKAYRAAGLNFEHLAIQNEPSHSAAWNGSSCKQSFPHMRWTGSQLADFLKTNLGPAFEAEGIAEDVGIFLATFSPPKGNAADYASLVAPTLTDPDAVKYLSGVGLQYAGIGMIDAIRRASPALKTWETETPCGNGRARDCGNGPGTRNNSWSWGEGQWRTMRAYLEAGASVYSQWNMVLDQKGESFVGWTQCSPVMVDTDTKTVTYEGSYWATKHYSYYVDVGASMVTTTGDIGRCTTVNGACGCEKTSGCGSDTNQYISFVNPDGSVVVVGLNAGDAVQQLTIKVGGAAVVANAALPPHSFNTFKVPASRVNAATATATAGVAAGSDLPSCPYGGTSNCAQSATNDPHCAEQGECKYQPAGACQCPPTGQVCGAGFPMCSDGGNCFDCNAAMGGCNRTGSCPGPPPRAGAGGWGAAREGGGRPLWA